MIPDVPSGSYLTEGLVMISMDSILSERIPSSMLVRSLPESLEGRPLMKIRTPVFP